MHAGKKFVMKYLITNQNHHKSNFQVFSGLHEFDFLEIYIYINKKIFITFDWNKDT